MIIHRHRGQAMRLQSIGVVAARALPAKPRFMGISELA